MAYAELVSTSNFSFLRGGSHPGELVHQAAKLGLSGPVSATETRWRRRARAYRGSGGLGDQSCVGYLAGARLVFSDKTPDIIVYPTGRAAYGRLCALLTTGNRRAAKGSCTLRFDGLLADAEGQPFIIFGDNEPFSADKFVAESSRP